MLTRKTDDLSERDETREREEPRNEDNQQRAERRPMGGHSQNLQVSGLESGYVPRWFNDEGDRLRQARMAGYQPIMQDGAMGKVDVSGGNVDAEQGQWIRKHVGETKTGPLYAYLMAIKEEWYLEDQARKMADINEVDQAIKTGNTLTSQGTPDDQGKTYVKQASIEHNAQFRR